MQNQLNWRLVTDVSHPQKQAILSDLRQVFDHLHLSTTILRYGEAGWAVLASLPSLLAAADKGGQQIVIENLTVDDVELGAPILFLSSVDVVQALSQLFTALNNGALALERPLWFGIYQTPDVPPDLASHLQALGIETVAGTIRIGAQPNHRHQFALYHQPQAQTATSRALASGPKEPFEGEDNLAKRADWFERRSGGRQAPPVEN